MEDLGLKTCTGCKEAKPRNHFTRNTKAKDHLSYQCRECLRLYTIRKKENALVFWIDESEPTTLIGCNRCGYRELFLGAEVARSALAKHRSIPHPQN